MSIKIADTLRTDNSTYPIALSEDIQGGIRGVQSEADLSKINQSLIADGMLVWVQDEDSYYKYTNDSWSILKTSSNQDTLGIQLLTSNQIKLLKEQNALPETYIWIRTKDEIDFDGEITDKTYTTTKNGNYIDILFQAVRQLQTEVAKMRNTFKYGMYSCTHKEMAISNVVNDMKMTAAEEPLWAIEEDGLSYIDALDMQEVPRLVNKDIPAAVDNTSGTYIDITTLLGNKKVYWDYASSGDDENLIKTCEDPKLFIYLTVTNKEVNKIKYLLDFSLLLESQTSPDNNIDDIKFSDLLTSYKETLNIMLLLNRKQLKNDVLYGNNYLYVSISDYLTNNVILSGYYNPVDKQLHKNIQELGDQYFFSKIYFGYLKLNKLAIYSRYQDFTKFINETDKEIKPNIPDDSDYRYKVAHLTIRSVTDDAELHEIKQYLPNNELVWVEETRTLCIKTNNKVIAIGGNSSSSGGDDNKDNMTQEELINALTELGIVYESNNGLELKQAKVEDITFVNSNLSNKYTYSIDSDGNLHSSIIPKTTLHSRVENAALYTNNKNPGSSYNIRGFVANLVCKEKSKDASSTGAIMNETDRIHISQFYAPLSSDIDEGKIGCSHAFIELSNTSEYDFQLDGCYLHFFCLDNQQKETYYKLALSGVIPAGNTFLIRGKKYADYKNSNVFIKVNSFDLEWFVGKDSLLDLTVNIAYKAYGLALTYGDTVDGKEITSTTILVKQDNSGNYLYADNYIDGILYSISAANIPEAQKRWARYNGGYNVQSNSLFRETFLLDPAKQGFQALLSAKKDTSRARHEKDTDFTMLSLANEFIEFPKSNSVKAVSDFTPKASFEHKTVITEKSNINLNKPNMITCAFGINMLTTRCFNWISGGIFDEFIWIREKGTKEWLCRYESYTQSKCTVMKEKANEQITKKTFNLQDETEKDVQTYIYDRITGIFPGTTTEYTAHKVIINLPTPATGIKEYEYCVGRSLLDGTPDPEHSNLDDLYTFTMYANTYIPRIYQTTDQQGFHWIEYQVWAGAAIKINEYINNTKGDNVLPVLVNTGDMTQSGARISEWYDYYEAGKCLFKHLEQMNVVGNNDLANIDPTILGTGDDAGKSNSFYFHVFYCYEVDNFGNTAYPIINNKYIPSLYYFGTNDYRFIMINSEITSTCCKDWFNLDNYNIYTGYTIGENNTYKTGDTWVPIYDRLFAIMNNFTGKQFVTMCHEMPFTVITKANIKKATDVLIAQRSASGTSLVGSHLNSITANDTGFGFNWFSRLLEYFAVKGKTKLCIGGHKHTYAMSFPIRENYVYTEGDVEKDSKDGPMTMSATLNNELEKTVKWVKKLRYNEDKCIYDGVGEENVNTSKLPYIPKEVYSMNMNETTTIATASKAMNGFLPYQYLNTLNTTNAITYLMCQATGYKYSSNKELPAYTQAFSELIPQTTEKEKPSETQKYPMFIDIRFEDTTISYKLIMVDNIFGDKQLFTQKIYGTAPSVLKYMKIQANSLYGKWLTTDTDLKKL